LLGADATFDDSTVAGLVAHGQALAEQDNHSAAIEKYDGAIARDPGSADAHAWKSASLIALKRLDDAEPEIQKALKANGDEFTYQMIAGRLQIARGNIDEGSALYERAAKLSPRNAGKVYADLAAALADRVILLKRGRALSEGPAAEAITAETLARAFEVEVRIEVDSTGQRHFVPLAPIVSSP